MKRKVALVVIISIMTVVAFVFGMVVHDADAMTRYDHASGEIAHMRYYIDDYRHENGNYPSSLEEMLSKMDEGTEEEVKKILHDCWKNGYEYQRLSNGFRITARGFKFEFERTSEGYIVINKFSTNTIRDLTEGGRNRATTITTNRETGGATNRVP